MEAKNIQLHSRSCGSSMVSTPWRTITERGWTNDLKASRPTEVAIVPMVSVAIDRSLISASPVRWSAVDIVCKTDSIYGTNF